MAMVRMIGSSAAQALTGGAALVLTVGVAAAIEWKEHEDAKKLAGITVANEQAKSYFSNIIIPGYKSVKTLSLTDFWDMTDPKKPKSMLLPLAVIESMVKASGSGKPVLHTYENELSSSLTGLLTFYKTVFNRDFGKAEADDVTPVVLRNLIFIISEHCMKFSGYALDIRILEVIQEYIEAFCEGHEERTRYLTPVCASLVKARNALIEHSKKLSLEETIEDAWNPSKEATKGLMSDLTQLLTDAKLRAFTDLAKPELLAKGVVKPEFFKWFHFGTHPQRIDLVGSEFTREFMDAVKDYMDIATLEVMKKPSPPLHLSAKDQAKLEKKQHEEMLDFFKNMDNFITRVSSQRDESDPLKPITLEPIADQATRDSRAETIRKLITLFRKMSSILKILYRIYEYANYVGPQLAADPNNKTPGVNNDDSLFVVYVLSGFNALVKQQGSEVENDLKNIITAFQGAMLRKEERVLYNSILGHVRTIQGEINERINAILKGKLEQKPDDVNRQIQKEKHALLSFVHDLATAENIQTPFEVVSSSQAASSVPASASLPLEEKSHPLIHLLKTHDIGVQTEIASAELEDHATGSDGFFSKLFHRQPARMDFSGQTNDVVIAEEEKQKQGSSAASSSTRIMMQDIDIQTEIASIEPAHHDAGTDSFFTRFLHRKSAPLMIDFNVQTDAEMKQSDSSSAASSSVHQAAVEERKDDFPATLPSKLPPLISQPTTPVSNTQPLLSGHAPDEASSQTDPTIEEIDALLKTIKTHMAGSHNADWRLYDGVYKAVNELRYHASKLQNQREIFRHERATLLKSLTYEVCKIMKDFFAKPRNEWADQVINLSHDINDEFAEAKYSALSTMQPVGVKRFFSNTPTTICKINDVKSKLISLAEHFTPQVVSIRAR
jgi:hypothetical protein